MMLTNLAGILRSAGLRVQEQPGWQTRGHGGFKGVRGVLWHHTAGPKSGNYPSLNIVQNGRPGLEGPLANLGLARDGTWIVIAAGVAWHAGTGSYAGIPANEGNYYLIGVEAENTGTGEPWSAAQLDAYRRGTAALLKAYGLRFDRCIGHKEWAPGRKIDPYGLDMNAERQHVANYMKTGGVVSSPGGIEEMAFNDSFTDWAGNKQTVKSWMDNVDKRIAQLYHIFLTPGSEPSRIPGDKNKTNLRDAVMDSTAWTAISYGMIQELHRKVDELETGGVDVDAIASRVIERLGPQIADAVADKLAERLAQ